MPGVSVGNNVVIAADAVVPTIPDNGIAAGMSTKVIKTPTP